MKKTLSAILMCLVCASALAYGVKPVTGTWLNLVWQDDRNNYMNPLESDNTDPALWKTKVEDLHGMGVDYLVIMEVANDGLALYPSDIMPSAYPSGRKSPVDAIMETAASLNMKVFLSCGWARNQDDDMRDPFVIERQQQIMQELTALYKESPAFYGWYLPVESAFEPILPEHAVVGVNSLAAKARALTPDKIVMISPYGICYADIDNPLFEQRIAALDVDVIAYQDEVGCVREPQPLPRMREHFRKLGEIHRRTGIAFWANVESFTWEKPATNSRKSALVPAAFGRYLSQIVAVSEAGAERILSFAVCGIYDKTHPGAYNDYMAWKNGDAKWKLLEHILSNTVVPAPATAVNVADALLCDGRFGQENTSDPAWVCFPDGRMSVVLDLGGEEKVSEIAARFLNYKKKDMAVPVRVSFSFSRDGKNFTNSMETEVSPYRNDLHDCWTDVVRCECDRRARYVRIEASAPPKTKIMCDEILVNPEFVTPSVPTPSVDLTLIPPGEIVKFFSEFGDYCHSFAPSKPVMLATNSFDVKGAEETYLKLFDHLDILCPFGFARMAETDITGKEAADFLQGLCDRKACHFWFDLEAFLFYPDGSLYPRDFDGILTDLTMFDNFEKILCYQYPGVFNNPELHPQVGEDVGIELYRKYKAYYNANTQ